MALSTAKDRLQQHGLKGMLSERSTLVSAEDALDAIAAQLEDRTEREGLLEQIRHVAEHAVSLHDLTVVSLRGQDPESASLLIELAQMGAHLKPEHPKQGSPAAIRQFRFRLALYRLLHGQQRQQQACEKSGNAKPYLLFLGGQSDLGASFDLGQLHTLVYSGPVRFAKQFECSESALQQLGFAIRSTSFGPHWRLTMSLQRPDASAWRLFLDDWLPKVVITGRPLSCFNGTFFLPLDLILSDEFGADTDADPLSSVLLSKIDTRLKPYSYDIKQQPQPSPSTPPSEAYFSPIDAEHEAWAYFLPHLRRYLFNQPASEREQGNERIVPIREYRLLGRGAGQLSDLIWRLDVGNAGSIDLPITQVTLHSYFNGMLVLAIQVESHNSLTFDSWIDQLLYGNPTQRQQLVTHQYEHYLKFSKNARVLYPTYIDAEIEGKQFPKSLFQQGELLVRDDPAAMTTIIGSQSRFAATELLSKPVIYLLSRFFNLNEGDWSTFINRRLQHLPDDRMFVSVAYGLHGDLPVRAEQQRMFSYALYVDDDSMSYDFLDGYCYSPEFLLAKLEQTSYRRWQDIGTWIGFTDFSNAYLGSGDFFKDQIARKHVPYIYNRMLLSVLFYQLSLNHYNRRITEQTNILTGTEGGARKPRMQWMRSIKNQFKPPFTKLKREFILFTNQYWFVELSSQVQGKEQFRMQLDAIGIERQFEQIQRELDAADSYAGTVSSRFWAYIALIISGLALFEHLPTWIGYGKMGWQWLTNLFRC